MFGFSLTFHYICAINVARGWLKEKRLPLPACYDASCVNESSTNMKSDILSKTSAGGTAIMHRSLLGALRMGVLGVVLCLFMLPGSIGAVGKRHLTPVAPDSSDFIRASIVYFSPYDNYQSVLGHCALHMECPSEDFDLIFELTENFDVGIWQHFLGRYDVSMSRAETDTVISRSRREGRHAEEWTLNLTHHEKQRLWMLLDKEASKIMPEKKFCLVNSHCSSSVIHVLEKCTIGEYLDLGPRQGPLAFTLNDYIRWMFRDYPWYRFAVVTMGGDTFDREIPMESIANVEMMRQLFKQATLRTPDNADSMVVRPLLTGEHRELLPLAAKTATSVITPRMVLIALLVITLLVTFLEWVARMPRFALWFDHGLFMLYALWALAVVWFAIIGMTLADARWNWYLIPFNPIPVILWVCLRRRPGYKKVFLLYAVVLTLFLLATPLSLQIDLDHQLITTSLTIRCYSVFFQYRKPKFKKQSK